jgi:hypothetical protein
MAKNGRIQLPCDVVGVPAPAPPPKVMEGLHAAVQQGDMAPFVGATWMVMMAAGEAVCAVQLTGAASLSVSRGQLLQRCTRRRVHQATRRELAHVGQRERACSEKHVDQRSVSSQGGPQEGGKIQAQHAPCTAGVLTAGEQQVHVGSPPVLGDWRERLGWVQGLEKASSGLPTDWASSTGRPRPREQGGGILADCPATDACAVHGNRRWHSGRKRAACS